MKDVVKSTKFVCGWYSFHVVKDNVVNLLENVLLNSTFAQQMKFMI